MRTTRWLYVEYANGQRELYDVRADPDEMVNLAGSGRVSVEATLHRRLDALRTCAGATCQAPDQERCRRRMTDRARALRRATIAARERGGTGRRARFRSWYRKVWEFESPRSHHGDTLARSLASQGLSGPARGELGAPTTLTTHGVVRVVADAAIGVVLVLAASVVLVAADADLTFASTTLLVVVVAAAVVSYRAGLVAAVSAAASLTYFFTPPVHSFAIDQPDDVLALVAFVTASVAVGATVARLAELRRISALSMREARLRLALTSDLAAGVPTDVVLRRLAVELVELFELVVVPGPRRWRRRCGPRRRARTDRDACVMHADGLNLQLELGRALRASDRETIEALAAGIAAALDRERLDREARDQRVPRRPRPLTGRRSSPR